MVKNVQFVPRASDNGSSKDDRKGLFAFMSPDQKGTLFFLEPADAKKMTKVGNWGRKEFLDTLTSKAKYTIDCLMLKIPDDGIALAEQHGDGKVAEKIPPGIEVFKLECDTFAQYSIQTELDIDLEKLSFITDQVRKGESFKRTCMESFGMSVIKKVNSSNRPLPNPRKDKASLKCSEMWVEKMDSTFAPLFYHQIELLAQYSSKMSSAFDTVSMRTYRQIYMDLASSEEKRSAIRDNKDQAMGLFDLHILTVPKKGINYANTDHTDVNDGNDDVFNRAMEKKLEEHLKIWLKKSFSARHEQEEKLCKKNIKAIFHMIRRGLRKDANDGENVNQLAWSTDTTCGYQILYTGDKKREVLATFAYPSNKTVVEFEVGKLTFQTWTSFDTSHLTPIALSFDRDQVYLNDEHLTVLAWGGGGTSKIATFLGDCNLPSQEPRLNIRRLCEIMRNNNATDDVVEMATAQFPRFQTYITNFFEPAQDTSV